MIAGAVLMFLTNLNDGKPSLVAGVNLVTFPARCGWPGCVPVVWSILIVGMVFSTAVVGVPDCVATKCGFIGFRLIRMTLLLADVTMLGGSLPVALAVPMTTGRAASLASAVVNSMLCGDVVALDMAVTSGRSEGDVTIVLTGKSCLLDALGAANAVVGLSIILPSLSANRMGRSRMPERSADALAAESWWLAAAIAVVEVVSVLAGAEGAELCTTLVAGTMICWLLMMIFLFGCIGPGVETGWITGAGMIGVVWMG